MLVIDFVYAQRAFLHDAGVIGVFARAVGTCPGAKVAADADILIDENDAIFPRAYSSRHRDGVDDAGARQYSWDRIEREHAVTYPSDAPDQPGPRCRFHKGFPRPGGFGKLVTAQLQPPVEVLDEEFPFIPTTGRELEHWHTGAMTRRAMVLDALGPSAIAAVSRGTIARLGINPGRHNPRFDPSRHDRALFASGRWGAQRRRVHSLRFCRGGGEPAHQSEARPVRQNSRIQVLRGKGGEGDAAHGSGGVIKAPRVARLPRAHPTAPTCPIAFPGARRPGRCHPAFAWIGW